MEYEYVTNCVGVTSGDRYQVQFVAEFGEQTHIQFDIADHPQKLLPS